jgi:hypothetical protein
MRLAESAILVRIQPLFGLSAPVASPLESEKPTASPQRSPETRSLDLEIHRRCFSAVLFDLILDLLPLVERAQSSTFDCRDVYKHVSAAALRLSKSIALVGLNHFTVPRAIVDLPTDDPADIILVGGLAANAATELCTS